MTISQEPLSSRQEPLPFAGGEPDFSYLDLLNPQQRAAVTYMDGPALVIAGAGSGKTRVLTYKIVDLLRHGLNPSRIMALTFTNKAAREMKERIEGMVGSHTASRLWMGTFHSIFLRILRRHPQETGYKSNFTIYDTTDSRSLIKSIIKDLGLDEKVYKPATVASAISNAKNSLISAELYNRDRDNYENDRRANRPMTGRIYQIYTERCRIADAMDFDDILFNMNLLLRDYPAIRRHYQEFFQYLLVDEYQDTNFAQNLIVSQLTGEHQNLCVVGDDAQSIYSFRGANIANILSLEKQYPRLKIFKLEQNYRSTQNIINAAGSLIEKNTRQMKKSVFSENEPGEKVRVVYAYTDLDEAFLVANMITQYRLTNHDSLSDYAVLYRTNAQSRVLEEALRRRNIAYRIYGGLSFYQRKEIKDAICYFRVAINPDDDEALRRIINYPARGIGETTMKKLQARAIADSVSLWKVITDPEAHPTGVNSGTLRKLAGFAEMIGEFMKDNERGASAFELGQLIYNRTGILKELAFDKTPEAVSKRENLEELLSGLKDFVESREESGEGGTTMSDFLSEVSLATDQDEEEDKETPKVTLMTAHAAKGLEFNNVFVVGVEETLFPSQMAMSSQMEVEEERRLLYVAITRAKKNCVLTYAGSRYRNGQTVSSAPSRFLQDMNPRFLKVESSGVIASDNTLRTNPVGNYLSSGAGSATRPDAGRSGREYGAGRNALRTPSGAYISSPTPGKGNAGLKKVSALGSNAPLPQAAGRSELGFHPVSELSEGLRIYHPRFGKGIITGIGKVSGEDGITVDFPQVGEKKMLLRFAKFRIEE
ncbi:MAG: UvrD-helicase domain-containing protein [Bacteroides sp.]|nr:UvrD-helicase domain-containing protein [Bacteroides sp.]